MKILVITNRKLMGANRTDETLFGESVNTKGASEFRMAWAEKTGGGWQVDLVPESRTLTPENLPSRDAFLRFRDQMIANDKDGVFYVHGFNKPFVESLEQAHEVQQRYGVAVATFSWPANPGGFVASEYRQAQAIARDSVVALDRVFERMLRYFREHTDEQCGCSVNLLIHSLGNYLFEHFVRDPVFSGETRMFDNIVLNAPDVNLDGHREWVDRLRFSRRVYVTINERDRVLDSSDVINPDRLGNTTRRLKSRRAVYLDLTDGPGVAKKHRHFESTAEDNARVQAFFQAALHGAAALPAEGFELNPDKHAYQLS